MQTVDELLKRLENNEARLARLAKLIVEASNFYGEGKLIKICKEDIEEIGAFISKLKQIYKSSTKIKTTPKDFKDGATEIENELENKLENKLNSVERIIAMIPYMENVKQAWQDLTKELGNQCPSLQRFAVWKEFMDKAAVPSPPGFDEMYNLATADDHSEAVAGLIDSDPGDIRLKAIRAVDPEPSRACKAFDGALVRAINDYKSQIDAKDNARSAQQHKAPSANAAGPSESQQSSTPLPTNPAAMEMSGPSEQPHKVSVSEPPPILQRGMLLQESIGVAILRTKAFRPEIVWGNTNSTQGLLATIIHKEKLKASIVE